MKCELVPRTAQLRLRTVILLYHGTAAAAAAIAAAAAAAVPWYKRICWFVVLVCWFVVNVADFWYDVVENRLSNSKLHYYFVVLHFWLLSCAWDPSSSFQSNFCCSYCFACSFLFGIRLGRLLFLSVFGVGVV